jgi:hypothetical protein
MGPFKLMISAVALTAFTATGAIAQDHHRERGNQGQRTPQADQARPRAQAQPRQQPQSRQQQAQPRRQEAQPRTFEQRGPQTQPRTFEQRGPQAQPRTFEQRGPQAQPRTFEQRGPQAQPRAYAPQVQPRTYDRRGTEIRPDSRSYSGDRAVPRTYETARPYRNESRGYYGGRTYAYVSPRIVRPEFDGFAPYRPYVYRPSLRIGVYYGYDGYYPYGYTPDYYFNPIPGHLYGGLRIVNAPRDAQVFADGYYVGIVDDFDGIFQHLNLETGPHHIEINEPGLQPVAFDVNIAPGRTMTFRADPYMFQP